MEAEVGKVRVDGEGGRPDLLDTERITKLTLLILLIVCSISSCGCELLRPRWYGTLNEVELELAPNELALEPEVDVVAADECTTPAAESCGFLGSRGRELQNELRCGVVCLPLPTCQLLLPPVCDVRPVVSEPRF